MNTKPPQIQVDVKAVIQAISNQRDEAIDRLGMAEARIIDLTSQLDEAVAAIAAKDKANASEE